MDKSLILKEIKKYYNFKTDGEFADFLGIKQNTLSNWSTRNSIDYDRIISKCDEIDANWLITGKGSMLKLQNNTVDEPNIAYYSISKYKLSDKSHKKEKRIPLIPIEAIAGFGSGEMQVMDYDTNTYVVPEFNELNVEFMIRIKGSSMYPKYSSGDIVGCKKLPLDTFFQWNKVYVIDTIQGPIIKRVHKSNKEDCIICVSENEKYTPFQLQKSEIYSLAIVLGVIRLE